MKFLKYYLYRLKFINLRRHYYRSKIFFKQYFQSTVEIKCIGKYLIHRKY